MAQEYVGNIIPAPGYYQGDTSTDDELLASSARFTQKGVTLAPGQGVIPLGTVMERGADKRWIKATTDAADTYPLRTGVDTGSSADAKVLLGNIVIAGILKLDRVRAAVDVEAYASAMGARTDANLNIFVL